ncbi:aspartate/glutamate racemase family protein [Lentisphaera profundi]|uniref:Aspartate/glutamate racemase family protein n=1 Tax=Lentisphaera profundi TaxID=1658616 RepID=A0ABY7VR61_9BACT|nr:aspartate/glutamate racemase family protein [Lentisphaera profundi]WDE96693.1 aspartate/glutamate racemase family protein [Lentisphaera profundi]
MTLPKLVKLSELSLKEPAVFILDSGAGAHSIYQQCKKLRPEMNYVILEDQGFFPYGDKSNTELTEHLQTIAEEIRLHSPISLILACNTASTHGLEIFRQSLTCPVIGTVPPIKTAVAQSKTKKLALLATPATINSPYTAQLLEDFATNTETHLIPTANLAQISENFFRNNSLCTQKLSQELHPLTKIVDLDTIALGCTHYHLIKSEIKKLFPDCEIIDCSPAIAKQFHRVSPQIMSQRPRLTRCYI